MRKTLGLTVLVLMPALTASGGEKKEQPANLPIKAKLVANKTTYKLDLGGTSAEEFKKAVEAADKAGKPLPPAPAVDLAIELTNVGNGEVKVWVGGDGATLMMAMGGPGALGAVYRGPMTQEFRVPRTVTLAPGKSVTIPLKDLSMGPRGTWRLYWTAPGEYELGASYDTAISPAPPGSKDAGDGFGRVILSAGPVKLKVEGK